MTKVKEGTDENDHKDSAIEKERRWWAMITLLAKDYECLVTRRM